MPKPFDICKAYYVPEMGTGVRPSPGAAGWENECRLRNPSRAV